MTVPRALLVASLVVPAAAVALEPRFDHRDTHGPFVEALALHDTTTIAGRGTLSSWRPALRAGWGVDVTGEGSELLVAADLALRTPHDPEREHVLVAATARYRAYFGTEELKTFFDVGVEAPLRSRLAVGPLVGIGVAYDFSRRSGVFAGGEFASAFGQARVISFGALAGAQLRFELP